MNVLVSHSYFLRFDPKQYSIGLPYAPLGTLYAAACLRDAGFQVAVFDTMFCNDVTEVENALNNTRPDIFVIYEDGFNYLTKMCLTNMREAAFQMIKVAKGLGCTVIVSGSDSTDHFETYLAEGADYILLGEGEKTLVELVKAISNNMQDVSGINGLAYVSGNAVMKTMPRAILRDLDSLPFPAWDMIDVNPYRKTWLKNAGYFSMNVASTRGCPFKCNWCAKPIYGNRYNCRTPANVARELKMLKDQYGFDHIWFCDDIFGLKPGWIKEFEKELREEGLSFRFKIQARADLLLEEENVKALAAAGCENVWMGAESGSQKILDAMDKGITIEQVSKATMLLKKHRINPSFFIQFGYPGETKEDINLTIRMINRLLPYQIGISVSYPLKGTKFFDKVRGELEHKSNWTDSDELAMMFTNTYKPAFYKQLHRYVHKSYRKHLAFDQVKTLVRYPLSTNLGRLRKVLSGLYYIPASFIDKIKLNQLAKS